MGAASEMGREAEIVDEFERVGTFLADDELDRPMYETESTEGSSEYETDEREAIRSDGRGPPPVPILDAAAIWAPLPEPTYAVAGVLRSGSVCELIAYGGTGKSWLAADLAVAVAAGQSWLHWFDVPEPGEALYVDYEGGRYETSRRFQAVSIGRGIVGPVDGVELAVMPPLYMTDSDFESKMTWLAEGKRVVIVDTLKAASPGTDENDSRIRQGIDVLHRVGEKTDAAIVVLAHAKKTSGNATKIDPREAGRGSSAIFDAADTVLHLDYRQNAPCVLSQTKARHGQTIEPCEVTISNTGNKGVRVAASELPDEITLDKSARFEDLMQRTLETIRNYPGSRHRELKKETMGRDSSVSKAIKELERRGEIVNRSSGRANAWFIADHKNAGK